MSQTASEPCLFRIIRRFGPNSRYCLGASPRTTGEKRGRVGLPPDFATDGESAAGQHQPRDKPAIDSSQPMPGLFLNKTGGVSPEFDPDGLRGVSPQVRGLHLAIAAIFVRRSRKDSGESGALARVFGAYLCLRSQAEALRSQSPKKMGSVRSKTPRTCGYTRLRESLTIYRGPSLRNGIVRLYLRHILADLRRILARPAYRLRESGLSRCVLRRNL